jgi:hypothetical protein
MLTTDKVLWNIVCHERQENCKLYQKQTFLGSVPSLCQMQFQKYIPPSPLGELFAFQWKDTYK